MLLRGPYSPGLNDSRMRAHGDLAAHRKRYFERRPSNLLFLVRSRYQWMNEYVEGKERVIEIGAGPGFSKEIIRNPKLELTEIEKYPWVSRALDALAPDLEDSSVDALISSHMIHHLAHPPVFFRAMRRVLKPGGVLLIQEIQTSLLMRALLQLMRHEGWSYEVDVFKDDAPANDPREPWSANCAIPDLLFRDPERFHANVPGFKIVRNELCEGLIFPLSGGIAAKAPTVNLPFFVLRGVALLDRLLIALAPSVFALGRRVVLQKI